MRPSLYFPVKPLFVNQSFGSNPSYYARFLDDSGKPIKGHMGIDLAAGHGCPVYAMHDGRACFVRDSHGGEGFHVYADGYKTIYWHLIGDTDKNYPSPVPLDGTFHPVKSGDLIGYANNTGAPFESSGDHLHIGLYLLDQSSNVLNPSNGFNGAVDPAPYFNRLYAQDIPSLIKLYSALATVLQHMVFLLKS